MNRYPLETEPRHPLARLLALNRTVAIVLITVLFFGLGEELWSSFMPLYLKALTKEQMREGIELGWKVLWTVGVYAFLRNVFEGFCYIGGAQLTARLGDRGSLILFTLLTTSGYLLVLPVEPPLAA